MIMQQYLELVDTVLSTGTHKPNRTGVDTISSFSEHYEVDLQDGYPLLTTKEMDGYRWNSMLHEVCWYLRRGNTSAISARKPRS